MSWSLADWLTLAVWAVIALFGVCSLLDMWRTIKKQRKEQALNVVAGKQRHGLKLAVLKAQKCKKQCND